MKRIITLVGLLILLVPRSSQGLFHLSVIDEVMTSYDNDPSVQLVEIRMLFSFQTFVRNSVLGAFDTQGNYLGDVLIIPADLSRGGTDVPWLMGTSQFEVVSGITPDFIMSAGLPVDGGMVCWGAPGSSVPSPESWDHSKADNYVDCLAYGNYSGPSNRHIGTPSPLVPVGHSLVRVTETEDNAADFVCGDPATPTNNAGMTVMLAATVSCNPEGDVNGDGLVDGEDIPALVAAIYSAPQPDAANLNGDDSVTAADLPALVQAIAASAS